MSIALQTELALYRGKLLRASFANGAFQDACKIAARHIARIDRIRLIECNGVPVYRGPRFEPDARSRTDEEQALADKQESESRAAIQSALRPFLTPGCVFKFYSDPRAAVCRVSNRQNTRDAFLGV